MSSPKNGYTSFNLYHLEIYDFKSPGTARLPSPDYDWVVSTSTERMQYFASFTCTTTGQWRLTKQCEYLLVSWWTWSSLSLRQVNSDLALPWGPVRIFLRAAYLLQHIEELRGRNGGSTVMYCQSHIIFCMKLKMALETCYVIDCIWWWTLNLCNNILMVLFCFVFVVPPPHTHAHTSENWPNVSWWCGMRYCLSSQYVARYQPLEATFSEHSAVPRNCF